MLCVSKAVLPQVCKGVRQGAGAHSICDLRCQPSAHYLIHVVRLQGRAARVGSGAEPGGVRWAWGRHAVMHSAAAALACTASQVKQPGCRARPGQLPARFPAAHRQRDGAGAQEGVQGSVGGQEEGDVWGDAALQQAHICSKGRRRCFLGGVRPRPSGLNFMQAMVIARAGKVGRSFSRGCSQPQLAAQPSPTPVRAAVLSSRAAFNLTFDELANAADV